MRIALVVAALCVVGLAGCAEESAPKEEEQTFQEFELEATETTGVIRGVVVDEAIVPVAGAIVRLDTEDGPQAIANDQGAFGFSSVEPGIHNLLVDQDGYEATRMQTEVKAGVASPPVVKVMLTKDPSELPLVVPLVFAGYLDCSISTPAYRVAACGIANPGGIFRDNFLMTHTDLAPEPWWIQAEMIWESTQPAGDAMTFTTEHSAAAGGQIAPGAAGESPLMTYANRTAIADGPFVSHIMHRVFNFEHPLTTPPVPVCGIPNPVHGGTMCVKGVGATIQQSFDIYTHVFYRMEPTEGWRFSSDGPPA